MDAFEHEKMGLGELQTLPQLLRATAAAYGEATAVTLKGETIPDDAISFVELERRSAELARGLIARGIGKGSRIGFIHGNGPMFAVLLGALARIGAVAIPISTLIRANELVRVLRQSDVHGLVVQRSLLGHDYAERLCEALPELANSSPDLRIGAAPFLRWIVSDGGSLPSSFRDMAWLKDAASDVGEDLLEAVESEIHPTDQMVEIYTSGSMAQPKGVKHLHGPVMARARYIARMVGIKRGSEVTASLPMFWVGGMGMFLLPGLVAGATVACTEGTATSSRHAMGVVLAEEDKAIMGRAKPWWGLGMSETFGPYSYGDEFRAEGYPLCAPLDHIAEGYEVRVADSEDRPVGDGEIGEVQVRGYALTPGLHKLEWADYFTPDGFYHTGDLGLREGKRIHFIGRDGDMIKTSGANVSPAEVEMELQQLKGVHSAYVIGLPDPQRGQVVVAAVVAREGALDFTAIQAELKTRLSGYKVPRLYLQIAREDVPMLISNKVARREIAALAAARLGRSG